MEAPIESVLTEIRKLQPRGSLRPVEEAIGLLTEGVCHAEGAPAQTALALSELKLDPARIALGLLFAGQVDPARLAKHPVRELRGQTEALERLTQLRAIPYRPTGPGYPELFRRMVLSIVQDGPTLLVRLAERLARLKQASDDEETIRRQIAREALDVQAPLAHRLGVARFRRQIEELAFRYTSPELYDELATAIQSRIAGGERLIRQGSRGLAEELQQAGIDAQVVGRIKSLYSVYYKMQIRQCPLEEIFDLVALRIIVPSESDCYDTLGLIHSLWEVVPGRLKDYVATPKPNGYRSLHTTVLGPEGRMLEIQIRTFNMHALAEHGIAAHWLYKTSHAPSKTGTRPPAAFGAPLFYQNRIYVFTPRGEITELPHGATPIDFAYSIHTELGNHCVGAKADGQIIPLRRALHTGQTLEIMTSSRAEPRESWLEFTATTRARSKIRRWLRVTRERISRENGDRLLLRRLRSRGIRRSAFERQGELAPALRTLGFSSLDALLTSAGGRRKGGAVLIRKLLQEMENRQPVSPMAEARRPQTVPEDWQVEVRGMGRLQVNFSRCCTPIPPGPIVGYITRGRGVSIHRTGCANLAKLRTEPERVVEARWVGP